MVSTPPKPTGTASAPLTQDQFDAYVQSTYGRYPLTIVRGDGCKLYDSNGKVWSMSLSGNAPKVVKCVRRCAATDNRVVQDKYTVQYNSRGCTSITTVLLSVAPYHTSSSWLFVVVVESL